MHDHSFLKPKVMSSNNLFVICSTKPTGVKFGIKGKHQIVTIGVVRHFFH